MILKSETDILRDIKEFAKMLNGREYGMELTGVEEQQAKGLGFVIVYGYSDDNMELRGAINDEVSCYGGGIAYLTKTETLQECECECKYYKQAKELCKKIVAVWCEAEGYSWRYETDIPHETFNIYEDGELYCKGIVLSIEDLEVEK